MKQPTLKEVKKHFKKALIVESPAGSFDGKIKIKSIRWHDKEKEKYIACDCDNSVGIITLWGYDTGYSKILTYKEKTFSITESQINEYSKERENCLITQHVLRELFPEAFKSEIKLEVGKWYKKKDFGMFKFCFNGEYGQHSQYGFNREGEWSNMLGIYEDEEYLELREQEVFEALKNEAVKRGFVGDVCFAPANAFDDMIVNIGLGERYCFVKSENKLLINNYACFYKGKWASLVESITLSEAEQQLGKKIIV